MRRLNLLARLLVAVAALALFAVGCGSDDDDDATSDDTVDTTEGGTTGDEPVDEDDLPVVRFQAVAGSIGGLPLMVMEEEGLDVENGFKGEFSYLDPGGASENFLVGNADVNMGDDVSTTAVFRQEGFDVTAWYPVTNLHVSIVVPEDSDYETPEDLIGEQVGHFGLESGATTYISTTVEEIYGFDPREDYTLVESGPPALPELLAAGEVDAIFNFEGHVSRAVLEAPGRVLYQTHQAYSEHTGGYAPTLTNLLSTVDWLEENPELAYSVRDAIDEAIGMIEESDYELISEETYTEQLGLEDPAHVELLIERAADIPVFTTNWSAEFIEQTRDFLDLLVTDGLLSEPPDEMVMTTLEALVGERP